MTQFLIPGVGVVNDTDVGGGLLIPGAGVFVATSVTTEAGIAATETSDSAALTAENWTTAAIDATESSDTAEIAARVAVGRRWGNKKYCITIKGARFIVPEDQLDEWLARQEEEIIEEAAKPVTIKNNRIRVVNDVPAIKVKKAPESNAPDTYVRDLIADANRRVAQKVHEYRKAMQEEQDDEEALLLLM